MPKTRYWALAFVSLIWMITLFFWNAPNSPSVVSVGPLMSLLLALYVVPASPTSVIEIARLTCILQVIASLAIWLSFSYSERHQAYFATTAEFLLLSSIPTIGWFVRYFWLQFKIEKVGKTELPQEKNVTAQTSGREVSFDVSSRCTANGTPSTASELALLDHATTANIVVRPGRILTMEGDGAVFEPYEMQIPFVRILQSPALQQDAKKPELSEGGLEGDIYNTVTGQIWAGDTGLVIIPCYQTTKYLEVVRHESGCGSWREIRSNDPILQHATRKGSKEILPTGNQLVRSDYHFGLILDEEGMVQPIAIEMKLNQLSVSRRWKTQIAALRVRNPVTGTSITPPLATTMWHLTSIEETYEKSKFFNWSVERIGTVEGDELRLNAESFRNQLMYSELKTQLETVATK
jgi:hypothetical protein